MNHNVCYTRVLTSIVPAYNYYFFSLPATKIMTAWLNNQSTLKGYIVSPMQTLICIASCVYLDQCMLAWLSFETGTFAMQWLDR